MHTSTHTHVHTHTTRMRNTHTHTQHACATHTRTCSAHFALYCGCCSLLGGSAAAVLEIEPPFAASTAASPPSTPRTSPSGVIVRDTALLSALACVRIRVCDVRIRMCDVRIRMCDVRIRVCDVRVLCIRNTCASLANQNPRFHAY
jgi:hypothetical protein